MLPPVTPKRTTPATLLNQAPPFSSPFPTSNTPLQHPTTCVSKGQVASLPHATL